MGRIVPGARIAAMSGLNLIHEDEHLIVLDKPAGLLAVPGRGPDKQDCLSTRAQARWPDALIVHRLDMATSGIVLMARGIDMQRKLSMLFEKRRVDKRYTAVVAGALANPGNAWQTIDLPLMIDWLNRPRSIVHHGMGKPSLTRWRLADDQETHAGIGTRLELEPVTGRTHQLRVHLQAIGHPIVGDPLYASETQRTLADRLLLHAGWLALPHPANGNPIEFHSPCPF
ncbi:MAG: RluA family pseudouridine synthase [Hydrogenophaga sp.]|nr:RluA family pseudouridine synthase [Hydrogenophaga sp.]